MYVKNVCMYVYVGYILHVQCMYVCMYVCMYLCIYVLMYLCIYVFMYVFTYVCMYACIYRREYKYCADILNIVAYYVNLVSTRAKFRSFRCMPSIANLDADPYLEW